MAAGSARPLEGHPLQTSVGDLPTTQTHGEPLRQTLGVWTRIAVLSFGSPALQLAAMYRILVEERRWISQRRFLNALNYCLALPGPEAQLMAAYVGWTTHGTLRGIVAGTLVVLPGMICMMAMSYAYIAGGDSAIADALFFGLKPAVLVIILEAFIRIARRVLQTRLMVTIATLSKSVNIWKRWTTPMGV